MTLITIGDWNPYGEFWFHEDRIFDDTENVYINELTYRSAPEIIDLPEVQGVIKTVESYKDKDPNFYRVHGLGLTGKLEGLVYPHFELVDELPAGDYFYGLDYGTVDPTVLVKNLFIGEKLYSQEMFYRELQDVSQIAREMDKAGVKPGEPVYSDPNEPFIANELRSRFNYNMAETMSGKGSVEFGIQKVNQFYQFWTKGSLNCIKEQRNYRYLPDKQTGELTDNTTHKWSHGMDARRYAVASYKVNRRRPGVISISMR